MNMEIGWEKWQINNNRPFYFRITPKIVLLKLLFVQTTINPSVGCTAKGFVQKDKRHETASKKGNYFCFSHLFGRQK